MRRSLLGLAIVAALAHPAAAQNVADNAGRWWNQPQSGDVFRFYNPLTTVYGRIGLLYSFNQNVLASSGNTESIADQWGAVLGMGARLMPILRAEIMASGIFTAPTRNVTVVPAFYFARARSSQIMANFFFDGAPFLGMSAWGLNPYAMAGLGVSFNTLAIGAVQPALAGADHTRVEFAWNLGAGLQYQPINNLILDIGYRYLNQGRFGTNPAFVGPPPLIFNRVTSHQIMFSLVIPFDGLVR